MLQFRHQQHTSKSHFWTWLVTANIVLSNTDYNVVGTRPIRPDGANKVTGRAKYGGDFQMSGLLHGQVLRSPHAHARIKSIDTSKAEAHPGVKPVVTASELPISSMENPDQSMRHASDNVLAHRDGLEPPFVCSVS